MNSDLTEIVLTSADQPARFEFSHESATSDTVLALQSDIQNWVIQATRKLDALARRQRNWDSYDGLPLRQDANEATMSVLKSLRTVPLPVPSVVLGSGGTVHIEWRARKKELEVEMGGNAKIDYVKVFPEGEIQEGHFRSPFCVRLRELTDWLLESAE